VRSQWQVQGTEIKPVSTGPRPIAEVQKVHSNAGKRPLSMADPLPNQLE
jgi:hypothetical protein